MFDQPIQFFITLHRGEVRMWDLITLECFQKFKMGEYVTDFLLMDQYNFMISCSYNSKPLSLYSCNSSQSNNRKTTKKNKSTQSKANPPQLSDSKYPTDKSVKNGDDTNLSLSIITSPSMERQSNEKQPLLKNDSNNSSGACNCCTIL